LLIGVTEFFRDPPAWDALRASVIARLIANRGADDTIRIWVPGCATGEEAYSIAILLREALEREQVAPRVQIFATDLDEQAIAAARRGRYAAPVQGLSPERLERWFTLEGKYVSAVKDIREMCTFSRQNVAKDPPFSNLDLVSCRNLLIYLDTDLQDSVLRRLHYALKPGGYLFLGISESISRSGKLFDVVDEKQHIFRRGDMLPQPLRDFALPRPLQPTGQSGAGLARHTDDQIDRRVQRAIEKHALVYVVIDRHHDILRFSGGEAALYLEPSPGTASLNLFSMLRQALRPSVRAAVQQVFDSGQPVREDNLTIDADSQARTVSFSAEPVAADGGDIELCVIVFHDAGPAKGDPITGDHAAAALEKQVRGLKAQLDRALAELGVKNEEIKSVTEEYQSVNEELQAANEELETSKEEMQSVNEELQTINAEVNDKNGQLMQLNNDLRNLLASTEIATVFLDNDLIIKSFTPGIKKLFHLRDSDRGRPLTELVPRADYAGLQDDVARVLRDGIVVERAVNVPTAQMVFLMRIRPYRTQDGTVDGVVITFVDISARYRKNLAHRDLLLQELSHRVKNTLATVGSIAAQTLKTSATLEAFENRFFGRLKTLAQTHDLLTRTEWRGTSLRDLVRAEFAVYGSDKDRRWKLKGPDVQLNAKAALAVGLALHELMSNATTYGALTTPVGCIDLHWRIDGAEEDCVLHLDWVEQGGPPVEKPARPGFGLRLIEQGLAYELDADVKLDFHADGLRCTMRLPLERAVEVEPV
ncbi:MAG TPA: CheR family methyltransferase, partial [Gammaproteobacteria bacterium]|nr:CheR family methyltransferase [Gammaproteobacteria bacterium]